MPNTHTTPAPTSAADEILDRAADQLRRFADATAADTTLHPDCADDACAYVHGALDHIALARDILHTPAD